MAAGLCILAQFAERSRGGYHWPVGGVGELPVRTDQSSVLEFGRPQPGLGGFKRCCADVSCSVCCAYSAPEVSGCKDRSHLDHTDMDRTDSRCRDDLALAVLNIRWHDQSAIDSIRIP